MPLSIAKDYADFALRHTSTYGSGFWSRTTLTQPVGSLGVEVPRCQAQRALVFPILFHVLGSENLMRTLLRRLLPHPLRKVPGCVNDSRRPENLQGVAMAWVVQEELRLLPDGNLSKAPSRLILKAEASGSASSPASAARPMPQAVHDEQALAKRLLLNSDWTEDSCACRLLVSAFKQITSNRRAKVLGGGSKAHFVSCSGLSRVMGPKVSENLVSYILLFVRAKVAAAVVVVVEVVLLLELGGFHWQISFQRMRRCRCTFFSHRRRQRVGRLLPRPCATVPRCHEELPNPKFDWPCDRRSLA